MKSRRLRACALALSGLASAGQAETIGYECQLKNTRPGGLVPTVLFIGHEEETDKVVVSAPIILHYNDKRPVQGRMKTDNAKRITFTWTLDVSNHVGQEATVLYTATYLKANGEVNVAAHVLGYDNTASTGRGECRRRAVK